DREVVIQEGPDRREAGGQDQQVDPPVLRGDGLERPPHLVLVRDITGYAVRARSGGLGSVQPDHRIPTLIEPVGDEPTDAPRRPGDDRDPLSHVGSVGPAGRSRRPPGWSWS